MFYIYGNINCPYCILTKNLLIKNNINYQFGEIIDILKFNKKINRDFTTIPIIYFNDKYIGGYTELIKYIKNDIIIYGKLDCKYCIMAKQLLDDKNIKYVFKNIKELLYHNFKTIPIIYINNNYIGGYKELFEYIHINL